MIRIEEQYTNNRRKNHVITIYNDNPSPKSYASYILLTQELYNREEPDYMEWINFRQSFLENKLKETGNLVCEFCGKSHLEIGHSERNKLKYNNKNKNLATIDHLLAKSKYPQFSMSKWNMAVSCRECNKEKGDLLMEEWIEKKPQIDWYSFFENHQEVVKQVPSLQKYGYYYS